MTDRFNALTVILDRDIREDDAETLLSAIHQLRGVLKVIPHVADVATQVAQERLRRELSDKLLQVIKDFG